MSALPEPLFEIELGPEKVRFAPASLEELNKWLEKEQSTWDKIFNAPVPRGQDPSFLNGLGGAFKALTRARASASAAMSQSGGDLQTSLANAKEFTVQAFDVLRIPLSDSVRGRLLIEAHQTDPFAAKVALFTLDVGTPPGVVVPITSPSVARGLVLGAQIASASGKNVSRSAVLELLKKGEKALAEWDAEHARARERLDKTHRDLEEELSKQRKQREEENAAHGKLVIELKNTFSSELKSSKESLESFQNLTRKDIALKAPTEYWRGKSIQHRRNAFILFVLLVALMGIFGYVVSDMFPKLIAETPGGKVPSYGHIAVIVVVATLAFWVLRILVRLFFSQTHLAQDAQERVTMVTTYLALMETGKFEKGDLSVVLTALFRNAADGIVKDEGMPPSIWEIVTRQGK